LTAFFTDVFTAFSDALHRDADRLFLWSFIHSLTSFTHRLYSIINFIHSSTAMPTACFLDRRHSATVTSFNKNFIHSLTLFTN
jgi:hypothetical protein